MSQIIKVGMMKKVITLLLIIFLLAGCEWKLKDTFDIYSIERISSVEGSFILGCGSISGEEYFYAWRDKEGGLSLAKMSRSGSIIYEDGDEYQYVEKWRSYSSNHYKWKIHVPKGTILKEFKL